MRIGFIIVLGLFLIPYSKAQFFRVSGLNEYYFDMLEWNSIESGNPVDGFVRTAWIAKEYSPSQFFQIEYNKNQNGRASLIITNLNLFPDNEYQIAIGFDRDKQVYNKLKWNINIGGMYQFPQVIIYDNEIPIALLERMKSASNLYIIVSKKSKVGFLTDRTYVVPLKGSSSSINFVNSIEFN